MTKAIITDKQCMKNKMTAWMKAVVKYFCYNFCKNKKDHVCEICT